MDSIIEYIIVNCLSSAGYTNFSKRAIEHFKQAFVNNFSSFLNSLSAITLQAQRSKSNFIDINNAIRYKGKKVAVEDIEKCCMCSFARQNAACDDADNCIDVNSIDTKCSMHKSAMLPYNFDTEERQEIASFDNPIASNIDRFIHVYEHMPHFPPSHTFKRNYTKEIGKHRRPDGIKKKIEETVLVERSLIRMMKVRGELRPYANYLKKQ